MVMLSHMVPGDHTSEEILRLAPRPIAVVGNAAMEIPYGESIDRHASVIRMNSFVVKGFEEYVGTRFTHWVIHGLDDFPLPTTDVEVNPAFVSVMTFHHAGVSRLNYDINMCRPMVQWNRYAAAIKRGRRPSTGLILLCAISMLGLEADVYGFDGLTSGHYWDLDHMHDHEEESHVYENLTGITIHPTRV